MNEFLNIMLSLSLSGALLILVLLCIRPLIRDKLSKQWQYYIWLLVIARLLLPFAPETNLMGGLFQHFDPAVIQADPSPQPEQEPPGLPEADFTAVPGQEVSGGAARTEPQASPLSGVLDAARQNSAALCLLVWLIAAVGLLIRKITVYQSFVTYLRAGQTEVTDLALWERMGQLVEQAGVKRAVGLCTNSLISSPLLIGFFRPCIVLPSVDVSDSDFEFIILHELTHDRRHDMCYKWLVQITICLHWFNPLVYVMGREVNRACELSCDEAVIRSLDMQGRLSYGDALLNAMGGGGAYKSSLASVTLNESKERFKERLDAIMGYQKKSKAILGVTLLLTLAICCGAAYTGAYAAPVSASGGLPAGNTSAHMNGGQGGTSPAATPPAAPSSAPVKAGFSGVSVTGHGPVGLELVRSENAAVTFELLNMDHEENCTTGADVVNGTMQITVNYHAPSGLNVSFGPDYKNVVRVSIPDAVYAKFDIQSREMVVQMQDFNAPVHVKSHRAGFWLIDKTISQGTYHIEVVSGPVYMEADAFLKDITAHVDSGPLTICFRKAPTDLFLDSTKCGPVVERPDDWPAIYRIGSQTPKITLSNMGKAVIEVQSGKRNETSAMETLTIGDTVYYQVANETQLRSIGQGEYGLDKNYLQVADIQMSSEEWIPIGTEDRPFTGSYCGNGSEIIGLTMTDPDTKIIGLFGVADGANLYNITLRDYDIQTAGRNVTGKSIAPILALGRGTTRSYDNQAYPKER